MLAAARAVTPVYAADAVGPNYKDKSYWVSVTRTYDATTKQTTFIYVVTGTAPASHMVIVPCASSPTVVRAVGPGGAAPTNPQLFTDPPTGQTGVKFDPGPMGTYTVVFAGNIAEASFVIKNGNGYRTYLDCGSHTPPAPTTDTDHDGATDAVEDAHGSDATDADSDDDGVTDGSEIHNGTDPADADTDDDGASDAEEVEGGTTPTNPDTDSDGLPDGTEIHDTQTDPTNPDSDGGGTNDGAEVDNGRDPSNGVDDPILIPSPVDTDTDGLPDVQEEIIGTDPANADTDGDGASDGTELHDTTSDPQNPDSDDDGALDGPELSVGTDPPTPTATTTG
jgi:hypothetical protein